MKKHLFNRLLSLVLAAVMVLGLFPAVSAAPTGLRWEKTDVDVSWDRSDRLVPEEIHGMTPYKPTDLVRAAIVLEDAPTLKAGYSTQGIGTNTDARAYDLGLQKAQRDLADRISAQALGGRELDVVWNLTLVGNIISANVPYGKLDAVKAVEGVRDVILENSYAVQTAEEVSPNMSGANGMVGSGAAWQNGLTGAGTRIAIIDTGTDTDHQSFDNGAYLHALEENAAQKSMNYEAYAASLELLDADEIALVWKNLNVSERIKSSADKLYINEKLPFGANYVDCSLTVDHDHDDQGAHGSHVAGIAAANRFIPKGGGYIDALESVSVCGVAPDAQIITMKIFGNADGPFESDYFAAIEDAIWLGCDSVNLSLGTANPGYSHNTMFAELLDFMATTDTVVVMSSGNSGYWAENTNGGYLYSDGVSFHTGGTPGSHSNALTVASVDNGTGDDTEYCTMSQFSSWGVPGSLELKPEITAPGGGILSVEGADPSGSAYETQSGTSMAAPQVAGMAALVAEYIRANDLEEKTGMSVRHLAQSLLMSTAVPLRELDSGGEYYSILNQGAGLARVDLATTAESYVTVAGQTDGKVKAELGEDAERAGVYEFSFTIHSLGDKDMTYVLSADVFTQQVFDGGEANGAMYLDTWTQGLGAQAAFFADGVSLERASAAFDCDLNGDGITSAADADYLLEYLLGNVSGLHADGDVSGDGKVNSYDAHVLLTRLSGVYYVDVPADGSVTIDVVLDLTEQTVEYLDTYYPTGAYVEGFVYAEPVGEGVAHSIPILGYYGTWTEPSMYDVGSYLENTGGLENRRPYLYDIYGNQFNYATVDYGDGKEYIFGGNPFVEEDVYRPARNAFNNQNGARLTALRYTQIRNAAASRLLVEDADTGKVYASENRGAVNAAFYHTSIGAWQETQKRAAVGLDFAGIPEGTRLNISLISAPEYYCTYTTDGKGDPVVEADWDALGAGARLTTSFTIDNTAPRIKNVELGADSTLMVTAQDNEYIAAIALVNASDTTILASAPVNQTERGVEMTCELDLSFVFGKEFLVAVYDYAENRSVYKVTLELENERPHFTAIDRNVLNPDDSPSYVGLDENNKHTYRWLADVSGRSVPRAVAYAEGAVFEVTDDHQLYVGFDNDLPGLRWLADLDPRGELMIKNFADLAYNRADGKLYGLFYSTEDLPYLCTLDLHTGQMTVLGQMPIDVNAMAIDDEGSFYSASWGSGELHTYTADVIKTQKTTCVGKLGGYGTTDLSAMAWDHNTDALYWMINTDSGSTLLQIDPETAKTTLVSTYIFTAGGLYIAYESDSGLFDPVDQVTAVSMAAEATTLAGNTVQLDAVVLPWNISSSAVTWSSSDAKVASVNEKGLVTGVSRGTAVITATSVLDSSKSASCTVSVSSLGKTLKAAIWDEDGKVWWSEFNTDTIPAYTQLADANLPVNATMMAEGTLYASTLDTSDGRSELYTVDPDTFAMTKVGSDSVAYLDMAYAPSLGYGLSVYFGYIVLIDLETGECGGAFEWNEGITSSLVGITYVGSQFNSSYGVYMDYFLILDQDGNVYLDAFMDTGSKLGYVHGPGEGYLKNIGAPVDYHFYQGFHYDGEYVYWSRFRESDNIVELRAWDYDGTDEVYSLGFFPEGVWPVAGLYTDAQLTGTRAIMEEEPSSASIRSAELMTAIPAVALCGSVKGGLNAVSNKAPDVKPLGDAVVKDDRSVDVTFTIPDTQATNGIVTVEFDSDVLELVNIRGTTEAFAWTLTADGKAQFAFANSTALDRGKPVALLSFHPLTTAKTTVRTSVGEWNDGIAHFDEDITVPARNPFTDVPAGSHYYDPVLWAVEKGITTGATETTFNPTGVCKRAQVVTFLWRAAGSPEPTSAKNPFTDVKAADYFYKAVLWAVERGITTGTSATRFTPDKECSRAQVVTFLWRYMGQPEPTVTGHPFQDVTDSAAYYYKAMLWAVEKGITTGKTATTFGPTDTCSRAQVVTFLYRALVK